ncbi:hypothetical protein [Marimonas arenosa]|uniref:Lipoprotein n=1 Tax=Marimonas arenosa TaxID=1795305 RepID=A0AAE4B5I7_9RHOB|nr:hypothetical protein [Marimonas arenosa]MDQ2092073.1 hypothetical protein [Marimonas arenosa]
MKRIAILGLLALGLAGCGADGDPIPPQSTATMHLVDHAVLL